VIDDVRLTMYDLKFAGAESLVEIQRGRRIVNRESLIGYRPLYIVSRQSSIVNRQLFIVDRQSYIVNRISSIVYRNS
jgi:hypothetical protein